MEQLPLSMESLPTTSPQLEAVRRLEAELSQLPQVDLATEHVVFGGMCARTILIPRGTALTGASTNKDNICIVHGDILVTMDDGVVRLTGYHVLHASKGHKRAGYALEDTFWTTLWPTELQDISAIEDEMTDESDLLQTRRALPYQHTLRLEE